MLSVCCDLLIYYIFFSWIFWLLPGPLKWLYELAAVYGPGYGPYEEAVKQFQG